MSNENSSTHDTFSKDTINSVARLRLIEDRGATVVLALPGTDYRLELVKGSDIPARPGEPVRGEIIAHALRMHESDSGGQFIEPVYGTPRIVQGLVRHVDVLNRRVLMDMALPVWVYIHKDNTVDQFHEGEMWNCYVESGARFEPVHA